MRKNSLSTPIPTPICTRTGSCMSLLPSPVSARLTALCPNTVSMRRVCNLNQKRTPANIRAPQQYTLDALCYAMKTHFHLIHAVVDLLAASYSPLLFLLYKKRQPELRSAMRQNNQQVDEVGGLNPLWLTYCLWHSNGKNTFPSNLHHRPHCMAFSISHGNSYPY